jgi:hypothetical protein
MSTKPVNKYNVNIVLTEWAVYDAETQIIPVDVMTLYTAAWRNLGG